MDKTLYRIVLKKFIKHCLHRETFFIFTGIEEIADRRCRFVHAGERQRKCTNLFIELKFYFEV